MNKSDMKIVYLGTPDFAVAPLQALVREGYRVQAVFTQPDKPRNRGQMQPTPVKRAALDLGLTVHAPARLNREPELLAACDPELLVVVAYGQLLSPQVLSLPRLGAVNIHASLLPQYRGAAPIQAAIMQGAKSSGVSIMYLDQGMDTGDVILSQALPIGADQTTGQLHDQLQTLGVELLLQALPLIAAGTAPRTPQDHAKASYAPMLTKGDEVIDWTRPAQAIHNQIRGLNPFPGAYTTWEGKRLKLWSSRLEPMAGQQARPGQVLATGKAGFWVACGEGSLLITEVQPEGKPKMPAPAYINGYRLTTGAILQ